MTIQSIVQTQRAFYQSHQTKSYKYRLNALKTLKQGILKHESAILEALHADLNKAPLEALMTEISIVILEINHMIRHLKRFMKPKRVKTPLTLFAASSYQYNEPYGVVLIMSPWNYPFQLAIDPLIGAIAGGNCAVVKPGSYAKHTAEAIKNLLDDCFEPAYVTTILGGREENNQLLDQPFDYIFFTGSKDVGKVVMEKASRHLTPISLELGGKSPCIIDGTVDMKLVAKRVTFGKFTNAGQTCVAPDYVFVHESSKEDFVKAMKEAITTALGENALINPDYPKIINAKHLERLKGLMVGSTVAFGGKSNDQQIEPTLLTDVTFESPVMQEEIFGPILPILTYQSIDECVDYINAHDKPLAFYLFSKSKPLFKRLMNDVAFGGATINDTLMHVASSDLAFGGVGASGMGAYHGIHSYRTFTHSKAVLNRKTAIDLSFRYHPYTKNKEKIIRMFTK